MSATNTFGEWVLNKKLLSTYLNLEKGGYCVYVMPVNQDTKSWTEHIRELHSTGLSKAGYEGFSNQVDDEYHPVGIYFFVVKDNEIVMTARINDRARSSRFAFEMGERPSGHQYVYHGSVTAVDINTYYLIPSHIDYAMPLIVAACGKYIEEFGAKKAFCLVDQENLTIQDIYQQAMFSYSTTFDEPIIFPSFLRASNQKPVEWRIMEWDEQAIQHHSEKHQAITLLTKNNT